MECSQIMGFSDIVYDTSFVPVHIRAVAQQDMSCHVFLMKDGSDATPLSARPT